MRRADSNELSVKHQEETESSPSRRKDMAMKSTFRITQMIEGMEDIDLPVTVATSFQIIWRLHRLIVNYN